MGLGGDLFALSATSEWKTTQSHTKYESEGGSFPTTTTTTQPPRANVCVDSQQDLEWAQTIFFCRDSRILSYSEGLLSCFQWNHANLKGNKEAEKESVYFNIFSKFPHMSNEDKYLYVCGLTWNKRSKEAFSTTSKGTAVCLSKPYQKKKNLCLSLDLSSIVLWVEWTAARCNSVWVTDLLPINLWDGHNYLAENDPYLFTSHSSKYICS